LAKRHARQEEITDEEFAGEIPLQSRTNIFILSLRPTAVNYLLFMGMKQSEYVILLLAFRVRR